MGTFNQNTNMFARSAVVAVVCALALAACDSPFFPGQVTVDPQPVTNTGNICPDVTESCCPQVAFDALDTIVTAYRDAFSEIDSAMGEAALGARDALNQVRNSPEYNQQCAATPQLCEDLETLIDAIADYFDGLNGNFANCGTEVINFFAGVGCLACSPNWEPFYNNQTDALIVTPETCTTIGDACLPIYEAGAAFVQAVSDAGIFGQAYANLITEVCNDATTCANYACGALRGSSLIDGALFLGFNLAGAPVQARDVPTYHQEVADKVFGLITDLQVKLQNAHPLIARGQTFGASEQDANGYAAVEAGRNSGMKTSLEGSAAAVTLSFGAAVVAAALL